MLPLVLKLLRMAFLLEKPLLGKLEKVEKNSTLHRIQQKKQIVFIEKVK
jgi:hypothetical protein